MMIVNVNESCCSKGVMQSEETCALVSMLHCYSFALVRFCTGTVLHWYGVALVQFCTGINVALVWFCTGKHSSKMHLPEITFLSLVLFAYFHFTGAKQPLKQGNFNF